MTQQLEDITTQVIAIREDATALMTSLHPDQALWTPGDGRWSVRDCLGHLNQTNAPYLDRLDAAISDARSRGVTGEGPFRRGILGPLLARQMEPPPRARMKTFTAYAPVGGAPEDVLQEFSRQKTTMLKLIELMEGLHLRRIRVASPVFPLLRLGLGQWPHFLAAHDRRHLWQARQLLSHPDFPIR